LKKIVTESMLEVNRKYMDPVSMSNCAHVFIASNHDQAVFTGTSARRWAMYNTTSNGGRPRDLRRFFELEALGQIAAYLYYPRPLGLRPDSHPGQCRACRAEDSLAAARWRR